MSWSQCCWQWRLGYLAACAEIDFAVTLTCPFKSFATLPQYQYAMLCYDPCLDFGSLQSLDTAEVSTEETMRSFCGLNIEVLQYSVRRNRYRWCANLFPWSSFLLSLVCQKKNLFHSSHSWRIKISVQCHSVIASVGHINPFAATDLLFSAYQNDNVLICSLKLHVPLSSVLYFTL